MTNIKTQHDIDELETQEWLDSLKAVIAEEGPERAHFLIEQLIDLNRRSGGHLPYQATTAYLNTIPVTEQKQLPGDSDLEWKIRAMIRWNAMAMVVRANRRPGSLGGHIASFASAATIYDVGFNHFFRGKTMKPVVICCMCKVTAHLGFMPVLIWKVELTSNNWINSAKRWVVKVCLPIHIPG